MSRDSTDAVGQAKQAKSYIGSFFVRANWFCVPRMGVVSPELGAPGTRYGLGARRMRQRLDLV